MYGRKSANSTENPLRGDRCRPARNPSTIHRAMISIRPSAARLAGSKRSARAARVVSMRGAKASQGRRPVVGGSNFRAGQGGPCLVHSLHPSLYTGPERRRGIVAISGLSIFARRTAAVLPFLAVLSACATTGAARTSGPAAPLDRAEERGPRVHLWTTDEFGSRDRVRPAFRLEDDAYVIVVNVGLDGYARVIFPESPDDDGFMRGGRTYRLPAFFPGFANTFRSS